jgi:hypothetical protein
MVRIHWNDAERDIVYSYLKANGLNDMTVYENGFMKNLVKEAEQQEGVRPRFADGTHFGRAVEYENYCKWLKERKAKGGGKTLSEQTQDRATKVARQRAAEATGHKPFQIPPGTPTSDDQVAMEPAASAAALTPQVRQDMQDPLNQALQQIGNYLHGQLDQIALIAQQSVKTAAQPVEVPQVQAPQVNLEEVFTKVDQQVKTMGQELKAELKLMLEEQSTKTRNLICAMHDSLMKAWDPNYKTDYVEEIKILESVPEGHGTPESPRRRRVAIITTQPKHFLGIATKVEGVDFEFILPSRAIQMQASDKFDLIVSTRLIDHEASERLKNTHKEKFVYIGHGTLPIVNAIKEKLLMH